MESRGHSLCGQGRGAGRHLPHAPVHQRLRPLFFVCQVARLDSGEHELSLQTENLKDTATICIHVLEKAGTPENVMVKEVWGTNALVELQLPKDDGSSEVTEYFVQKANKKTMKWFNLFKYNWHTSYMYLTSLWAMNTISEFTARTSAASVTHPASPRTRPGSSRQVAPALSVGGRPPSPRPAWGLTLTPLPTPLRGLATDGLLVLEGRWSPNSLDRCPHRCLPLPRHHLQVTGVQGA